MVNLADTPHGSTELSNGRLMSIGTTYSDEQQRFQSGAIAVESTNKGRAWHRVGAIPYPTDA